MIYFNTNIIPDNGSIKSKNNSNPSGQRKIERTPEQPNTGSSPAISNVYGYLLEQETGQAGLNIDKNPAVNATKNSETATGTDEVAGANEPAKNTKGSDTPVYEETIPPDEQDEEIILETDSEGRKTLSQLKRGNETLNIRTEYDENGRLKKEIVTNPNNDNHYEETLYNYEYDAEGNITAMTEIYKKGQNDNTPTVTTYKYNTDETIPHYNDDCNDAISQEVVYNLNNGGKIVEEYQQGINITNRIDQSVPNVKTEYDAQGNIVKRTEYTFDENGAVSAIKITDGNGNTIIEESNFEIDGNYNLSLQGSIGDCYLLASINTLSKTEQGLKILRNNVQHDKTSGAYTVTFPGAAKAREQLIQKGIPEETILIQGSYTITEEEIEAAAKSLKYSAGDRDVLLYEIAYEKYRQDASATAEVNNISGNTKYIPGLYGGNPHDNSTSRLTDGPGAEVFYMLTGSKTQTYERYNNSIHTGFDINRNNLEMTSSNNQSNKYVNPTGPNGVIGPDYNNLSNYGSVTHFSNNDETFNNIMQNIINDTNNYGQSQNFATCSLYINSEGKYSPHQFRIVSANLDEVTLVNPWDTSKQITVKMSEFKTGLFDLTLGKYPDKDYA